MASVVFVGGTGYTGGGVVSPSRSALREQVGRPAHHRGHVGIAY